MLPVGHRLLGDTCEVVRRSDRLERSDRLKLPAPVGGGADQQVDRLAADGRGLERGVLPLESRLDPQVDRVVEPDALDERRRLSDLADLGDRDRHE